MIADYLLMLNVCCDPLRKNLLSPWQDGEYIYASDAYTVIKITENFCSRKYRQNDETPKAASMFAPKEGAKCVTIKTHHLANAISLAQIEYSKQQCAECKGKGTINCKYCHHDHECETCNGYGVSGIIEDIAYRNDSGKHSIEIKGMFFKPSIIERVLIAALALQYDEIHFYYVEDTAIPVHAIIIENEIEFLVMQRNKSELNIQIDDDDLKPW